MKLFCKDKSHIFATCLLWLAAIIGFFPTSAHAQIDVVEVTPLHFGEIVIRDTNAVARVTIQPSGTYNYSANVYLHTPPTRGEYLLQSPNFNEAYTITVPGSATLTGPGGTFLLDNMAVRPNVLVTNGAGEDTFFLSGRLRSQGGGIGYGDGVYNNTFTITINF